jgi:hypothetical protein
MRGALAGSSPPLVIDLGGGDVPVTEQLLDLHNVHAGIEQERGGGGAERVRRVHAFDGFLAGRQFPLPPGVWDVAQEAFQDHPHGAEVHRCCRDAL